MEQDSLLLQDQAGGMDATVIDRWAALKKREVLRGNAQVIRLSASRDASLLGKLFLMPFLV
jgi:hypothetical protein